MSLLVWKELDLWTVSGLYIFSLQSHVAHMSVGILFVLLKGFKRFHGLVEKQYFLRP